MFYLIYYYIVILKKYLNILCKLKLYRDNKVIFNIFKWLELNFNFFLNKLGNLNKF